MSFDTQIPVLQKRQDLILYIKANMVSVRPSVCVDKNCAVPGRFFQSLPVPCGDQQGKAGRPGQPLRGAGQQFFLKLFSL